MLLQATGSARHEKESPAVKFGQRVSDRRSCRSLGRDTVAVVQSAESIEGVNLACHCRTYRCWPTCWRVLRECEVRPIFVVVANIFRHQPLEVLLLQYNHVVQQVS